jgi:hypothetical protein
MERLLIPSGLLPARRVASVDTLCVLKFQLVLMHSKVSAFPSLSLSFNQVAGLSDNASNILQLHPEHWLSCMKFYGDFPQFL